MDKKATAKSVKEIFKTVNIKHNIEYITGFPEKIKRSKHSCISIRHLEKTFSTNKKDINVLKNLHLTIYSKEFVIIYGPSGCGKSTLLHSILGLEHPTKGKVLVRKKNLYRMNENKRAIFRRKSFGTVFQQSNWIKSLSVIENVSYPLLLANYSRIEAKMLAEKSLDKVGLLHLKDHKPVELSGGEQQRVALARALVLDPKIIVADEPTGNLDTASGTKVMEILTRLNRTDKKVVIMVTHDTSFLPLANRVVGMLDGKIIIDTHD